MKISRERNEKNHIKKGKESDKKRVFEKKTKKKHENYEKR